MLKSYRVGWVVWVVWVAHVILVSAQGPNPSFFLLWGTFTQHGGLLGQGLGLGLGPGLDNFGYFGHRKLSKNIHVCIPYILPYCNILQALLLYISLLHVIPNFFFLSSCTSSPNMKRERNNIQMKF